jgi:regulatory protein YycI of two-component signal transduction system YycFG
MEWGRVKSIMIGIFCLVNIFLFLSYMDQTGTSVKISEESVQNTAVVLSNNNVYIDHKLIPRKLQDIRIFDAVNKYETPDAASKAFWEIAQSLGIDLFNPQKTVTDECIFEYKTYDDPQAYNLTESTALAYAKKIVSQLNLDFGMRLGSELSLSNDVFTVTYHQEYEGLKVLDTCLVIELANGGYTRIYGKNWLCNEVSGGGMSSIRPATEMLVSFAVSFPHESEVVISGIRLGYFIGNRQGRQITVTAVPTWEITTNEGVFYYDAKNGDFLQKEA